MAPTTSDSEATGTLAAFLGQSGATVLESVVVNRLYVMLPDGKFVILTVEGTK